MYMIRDINESFSSLDYLITPSKKTVVELGKKFKNVYEEICFSNDFFG